MPLPLYNNFDYLPPKEQLHLSTQINEKDHTSLEYVGRRVLVPFGTKTLIGIIIEVKNSSNLPISKLKSIIKIIDENPIFEKEHLNLLRWSSIYYKHPFGLVLDSALPTWFRKGKELSINKISINKKSSQKSSKKILLNTNAEIKQSFKLSKHQKQAIANIQQNIDKFIIHCLFGITGSGKTEVYLQVIEDIIKNKNQQALVLIPEIGLTPQTLDNFKNRFSNEDIVVLHSQISEKKKAIAFMKAKNGEAKIIIGTRSASLIPLKNPGIFIIDEEHDASFKQQDGFRYSAKDFLIKRASEHNIPIILGSATPSLETLNNSFKNKYSLLCLPTRVNNSYAPPINLLDIRHKKTIEGISYQLIDKIKQHIKNKGQIIIFLNRRGFAPVLYCNNCSWMAECKNCDAKLIVHYRKSILSCHHCNIKTKITKSCPKCDNNELLPLGLGTERIEKALREIFPKANIARIDKDTTLKKNAMSEIIEKIKNKELDIIIGTQMITKGHHFSNITLVGIIDVDSAFFCTDFRAIEKTGQLIIQVAGRAGRGNTNSEVVLQTTQIENPLLLSIVQKNYLEFAQTLLSERKYSNLPPYSFQILIRAQSKKLDLTFQFLYWIKNILIKEKDSNSTDKTILLGPIPAPMTKRKNTFRAQLLLQSNTRTSIHNKISLIFNNFNSVIKKKFNQVKWSIDVDPQEV